MATPTMHCRTNRQQFQTRKEVMNQVKLQTLEIVLHDNVINYETGDVVGGRCIIAIEGRIRRNMINIILTCVGNIKWYQQGKSFN